MFFDLEELKLKHKIVIYGAGDFGQKLEHILRKMKAELECFVQTEKGEQTEIGKLPVLSLDELIAMRKEYFVFIAINDKKVRHAIRVALRDKNYNMSLVYDMSSFIIDNKHQFYNGEKGTNECLLCGNKNIKFKAAGERNPIFLEKKIVGGGYRESVVCPCCGSSDRSRWAYWVLKNQTNIFEEECTVLHFAPEKQIQEKLQDNENCDYYAGDICRVGDLHKIDVTDIQFTDNIADYIIINHVMEHISEEGKAVSELKRVLKENGKIIMSFPISMIQKTFEDKTIISEKAREEYYGQKDHVRLYGIDYKERFENYGLDIKVFSPKEYMSDKEIEKYGLIREDILLICSKLR